MSKFKWWAVRLTDNDGTHTYGLEPSLFQLPDIYPTRKAAREGLRAWKNNDGNVNHFKPKIVRAIISVQEVSVAASTMTSISKVPDHKRKSGRKYTAIYEGDTSR